jgi:[acyl-carrier-protein] S-malonyltransferase
VGEYAALVAAGALEFAAALRLVSRRASLMAGAGGEGGMAAVLGLERAQVQAAVDGVARPIELVVANDNAPGQVVISGRRDALAAAEDAMRAAGARRVVPLPVSGAFHSPLMASVTDALSEAFEAEEWRDVRIPIVSNVTAEPVTDPGRIRSLLAEQVRSPVEWVASVERMVADGVDLMIECGAGTALTGMVRRIAPGVRTGSVTDAATLAAAGALLAGTAEAVGA